MIKNRSPQSAQSPASAPAINPNTVEINAEDYVAPRFARKMKSKVSFKSDFKHNFGRNEEKLLRNIFPPQLRQKILEAHANVKDLNLLEAKMNFKR